MARVTKSTAWQQEREQEALSAFEQALVGLDDPRRRQGLRYPLRSVVVIALMAAICGADDAEAMQAWGRANLEWLRGFLDLPHGTPSQDVFLAVFAAIDPQQFQQVFITWVAWLRAKLSQSQDGAHLALDGKTSRRSFDRAQGRPALHTVSAWLCEEGLVLGQCRVDQKSNEIRAIPELLALLELKGCTVTIDAMGCQKEIASTIISRGGHYLLAVKDNQPALSEEVQAAFTDAVDPRQRALDEDPALKLETVTDVTKEHDRIEERSVSVCRDLSWVATAKRWRGLAFIAMVVSTRTELSTGKTSTATRYFIGSDKDAGVERIATLIRRHWSIENELHWVLDMAFNDDYARFRSGHCAQNMAALRHFALNLLKQDKSCKLGIANKRKRAGWDRGYLMQLVTAG